MVIYKDFHFVHQRLLNLINRRQWNTGHLRGIAWSSGKLDYDKLFAVFDDIKVMNAQMFAEGFKKRRLLTRPIGRNVEILDGYDCPKKQDLVGEGKKESSWICCSYPFRYKTRLHCSKRKVMVH